MQPIKQDDGIHKVPCGGVAHHRIDKPPPRGERDHCNFAVHLTCLKPCGGLVVNFAPVCLKVLLDPPSSATMVGGEANNSSAQVVQGDVFEQLKAHKMAFFDMVLSPS